MDSNNVVKLVDDNEIYFNGEINEETTTLLIDFLAKAKKHCLNIKKEYNVVIPIKLFINSRGGIVHESFSIANYIKQSEIPIHTFIQGVAASGAAIISLAGHQRFMYKTSLCLIHQLSAENWGTFEQLKESQKMRKKEMKLMINFFSEHTKLSKSKIVKILKKDKWFDYKYCIKNGLVDVVL